MTPGFDAGADIVAAGLEGGFETGFGFLGFDKAAFGSLETGEGQLMGVAAFRKKLGLDGGGFGREDVAYLG